MSGRGGGRRLRLGDRARGWLVSGPIARMAAFGLDLGAALRQQLRGRRGKRLL